MAMALTANTGTSRRTNPIPELKIVKVSPCRLMREKIVVMLKSIEIGRIIGISGTIKRETIGKIIFVRVRPNVAIKSVSLKACEIKTSITKSNVVATNCFVASLVR